MSSQAKRALIDPAMDPVTRAQAAGTLAWEVPEATTEYFVLRDAAVHEALAAGVDPEQVGSALGVQVSDIERMDDDYERRQSQAR